MSNYKMTDKQRSYIIHLLKTTNHDLAEGLDLETMTGPQAHKVIKELKAIEDEPHTSRVRLC